MIAKIPWRLLVLTHFYRYSLLAETANWPPYNLLNYERKEKKTYANSLVTYDLTLLHSEQPKLQRGLAALSAIGLKKNINEWSFGRLG